MEIEEHTDLPFSDPRESSHSVGSINSEPHIKAETSRKTSHELPPSDDPTNPINRIEQMIKIIHTFPSNIFHKNLL